MRRIALLLVSLLLVQALLPSMALACNWPVISVSPLEVDFGSVQVGSSSSHQTVTVSNVGDADLHVCQIMIIDPDAIHFVIVADYATGVSIAPGASADIILQFIPLSVGEKKATLRIISDGAHCWCGTLVSLKGTGTEPPEPAPEIEVTPASVDFGSVEVGETGNRDVTVENKGNAGLVIGTITIDDPQFTIVSGNISGQTINPGDSETISLEFSPSSVGPQAGTLRIPNNDTDENPVEVPLSGTGTPKAPEIEVTPASVDFGLVEVGETGNRDVTVENKGNAGLVIGTITIDDPQFTIASGNISGQTINPGDSETISLEFSPSGVGPQTGALRIPNNDTDENPVDVPLSGTGTPKEPEIEVTPASVDFGSVEVGETGNRDVTVENKGNAGLVIGTITIDDPQFTIVSGNISGQTINPGDSETISLEFSPSSVGPQTGTLRIPSNDTDENPVDVPLSGTGTEPPGPEQGADLEITKTDSPDPTLIGDNITYTLTVINHGPDNATGVSVNDTLPQYVLFESLDTSTGNATHDSGRTVTWDIGTLDIGDSVTLEIVVYVIPQNLSSLNSWVPIINYAEVHGNETDPVPGNNLVSEDTTVSVTDLLITKTVDPDPVMYGENFTWEITVTNNGTEDAIGVFVVDMFKSQHPVTSDNIVMIHSIDATAGTVNETAPEWFADIAQKLNTSLDPPAGYSILWWHVGDLAAGASANLTITASANLTSVFSEEAIGYLSLFELLQNYEFQLENQATVLSRIGDTNFEDNSAETTTTVKFILPEGDLEITKSDDPDPVAPGDNITYTLEVTNNGDDTATHVWVIDNWETSQLIYESATPSQGSANQTTPGWLTDLYDLMGSTPPADSAYLYWDIGELAAGASANLTMIAAANVTTAMQYGDPIENKAMVFGYIDDTNKDNNQVQIYTAISTTDLSIIKTAEPDQVMAGDNFTWEITITNESSTNVTDVIVADLFLTEYTIIKATSPSQGSIIPAAPAWSSVYFALYGLDINNLPDGTSALYWDVGDLAAGASVKLTITASSNVTIPGGGSIPPIQLPNMAMVTAKATDTNLDNNTAYATVTVNFPPPEADLEINKSDDPDPVIPGENFIYTLVVTNNGSANATGVKVYDNLPDDVTLQSNMPSQGSVSVIHAPSFSELLSLIWPSFPDGFPGIPDLSGLESLLQQMFPELYNMLLDIYYQTYGITPGVDLSWDVGELPAGASASLTILITAPPKQGIITNTADVSSDLSDPDWSNNFATENTTVSYESGADVEITKTDSDDPVAAGDNFTYTVTVTNHGPDDAPGFTVRDSLPTGTVYQDASATTGTYYPSVDTVYWSLTEGLAKDDSASLNITVTAPLVLGVITNNAMILGEFVDPVWDNNSVSENTTITRSDYSDLVITKLDEPDPVATGGDITYTVIVTNKGPDTAEYIWVTDTLPTDTIYQSAYASTGEVTPSVNSVGWYIDELAKGASENLTIVVTAPSYTGNITNTAIVNGEYPEVNFEDNTVSENTTVIEIPPYLDVGIAKSSDPDTVTTGDNFTYMLIVTNYGPVDATGVSITDQLPGSTTYQSAIQTAGSVSNVSGKITWNIANLAAGTSENLTIIVTAPLESCILLNTANVTCNETDIIPNNNSATVSTIVLPPVFNLPDISVSPLSIDFGSIRVGSSSSARTVTVTNVGTADLHLGSVTVSDSQFVITSSSIAGQTLLPGTSANITLVFNPAAVGSQSGTLTINSDDPNENSVIVTLRGNGTSASGQGSAGGLYMAPGRLYFTVDFLGEITKELASSDGRPINDMEAPSPDGVHLIEIEEGTRASDNLSQMVILLEIRETEVPELPDNTVLVGKAYEFKPSWTTFDKPIKLTLGYDVNELPENVQSIGTAYNDIVKGWIYLETENSVVAEMGKLTAPVNHFTTFAILATVAEPQPAPESPPEPEPTPKPEPEPPTVPPQEPAPASFRLSNLSITPSVSKTWESLTFTARNGEDVIIAVDVTNNGGQKGTYKAVLLINGIERGTKETRLDPGETERITFTISDNEPGVYLVQIGELEGDFLSELWINWWLISGFAVLLILLGWLAWYLIRRWRKGVA
jgi:uncharacterized repeat protein (TIGR01451 family)